MGPLGLAGLKDYWGPEAAYHAVVSIVTGAIPTTEEVRLIEARRSSTTGGDPARSFHEKRQRLPDLPPAVVPSTRGDGGLDMVK